MEVGVPRTEQEMPSVAGQRGPWVSGGREELSSLGRQAPGNIPAASVSVCCCSPAPHTVPSARGRSSQLCSKRNPHRCVLLPASLKLTQVFSVPLTPSTGWTRLQESATSVRRLPDTWCPPSCCLPELTHLPLCSQRLTQRSARRRTLVHRGWTEFDSSSVPAGKPRQRCSFSERL